MIEKYRIDIINIIIELILAIFGLLYIIFYVNIQTEYIKLMIISPVFVGLPLLLYILVKKINIEIVITHRSIRAPIMNWSEDKKIRRSLQPQIYEIDFIQIQRIEFIDYMGLPRDNMSHSIVLYLDDGDIKYIVTKGLLRSQRKRIYLYLNEYISNLTSLSM